MVRYLLNGFSPNMLVGEMSNRPVSVVFGTVNVDSVRDFVSRDFVSAIGHESTANLLSQLLGTDIETNRIMVELHRGDSGIIVSLGFRPEEGRVYSEEELSNFLNEGRIIFTYFTVME